MSMKENWDRWAESDPYYAVITHPSNRGGDNKVFWESGGHAASTAKMILSLVDLNISDMKIAELGVGVGRVGSQLNKMCSGYVGIDVSDKMMAVCSKHHPELKLQNVTEPFPNVDMFYSLITLQHCEHSEMNMLIDRMFKASKVAVMFQLPDIPYAGEMPHQDEPYMPMYGAPIVKVIEQAFTHGFSPSVILRDKSVGPNEDSYCYLFTRKNPLTYEQT